MALDEWGLLLPPMLVKKQICSVKASFSSGRGRQRQTRATHRVAPTARIKLHLIRFLPF